MPISPPLPPSTLLPLLPADALGLARVRAVPHLALRHTPWPSVLVHAGVLLLWALLFGMALGGVDGVAGWSVGVAYVLYDTLLLAFVGWQTLPLRRSPVPAPVPPPVPMAAALAAAASVAVEEGVAPSCRVCVLVACHNEADALPLTLDALFAQRSDILPEEMSNEAAEEAGSEAEGPWAGGQQRANGRP